MVIAESGEKMQNPDFHLVNVGYQQFYIDKRYTNLKACGDGSYGFVCSADDKVRVCECV